MITWDTQIKMYNLPIVPLVYSMAGVYFYYHRFQCHGNYLEWLRTIITMKAHKETMKAQKA